MGAFPKWNEATTTTTKQAEDVLPRLDAFLCGGGFNDWLWFRQERSIILMYHFWIINKDQYVVPGLWKIRRRRAGDGSKHSQTFPLRSSSTPMLPKALSALLYSSSQESGSDMIFLLVLLMLLVVLLLTSTSTRFTCIMPASSSQLSRPGTCAIAKIQNGTSSRRSSHSTANTIDMKVASLC